MNNFDKKYMSVLDDILHSGVYKTNRTGIGTHSHFGTMTRFDLSNNRLPLISLREVIYRSFIHETLWFLSGSTDIEYLKTNGVSIWDSWVDPKTKRTRPITHDELKAAVGKVLSVMRHNIDNKFTLPTVIGSMLDGIREEIIDTYSYDELKVGYEQTLALMARLYPDYDLTKYPQTEVLVGGSIGTGAYGSQWRNWEDTVKRPNTPDIQEEYESKGYTRVGVIGDEVIYHREIDQIANIINLLKTDPDSRRILMVAFNPGRVDHCQLPPCHSFAQWWTNKLSLLERTQFLTVEQMEEYNELQSRHLNSSSDDELHDVGWRWLDSQNIPTHALKCLLYMRSSDYPVGAVFNIPQYALLTHMIAQVTNMVATELVFVGGDTHIYENQIDGIKELQERKGHPEEARVVLNKDIKDIDDFTFDDIEIINYKHDARIKFPVAV